MNLQAAQPGDKVKIQEDVYKIKSIEDVVRVTKTRIVTNKRSYTKSYGRAVGYTDSWWPPMIIELIKNEEAESET